MWEKIWRRSIEKLRRWSISEKSLRWLGAIIPGVQAICGIVASVCNRGLKITLVVAVVICACFSTLISILQSRTVKTAKQKSQTLVSDSFGPLIGLLITQCSRSEKMKEEGIISLAMAVEGIAEQDVGSGRRRVSVFEVREGEEQNPRLKPMRGTDFGRNDRSTSTFFKNKGEGKEVWKKLIDEGISQCADISDSELLPSLWDGSRKREYRSYVSVRIDDVDKMYGMLTINSEEAGAFDEGDILELKVLAQILAFGMHMAVTDQQKSYLLKSDENGDDGGNSGESLSGCPTNC